MPPVGVHRILAQYCSGREQGWGRTVGRPTAGHGPDHAVVKQRSVREIGVSWAVGIRLALPVCPSRRRRKSLFALAPH